MKSSWKCYQSNGLTLPSLSVTWIIEYITEPLENKNNHVGNFNPPFLDANMVFGYCSPWMGRDYVNQNVLGWITIWMDDVFRKSMRTISVGNASTGVSDATVTMMIDENELQCKKYAQEYKNCGDLNPESCEEIAVKLEVKTKVVKGFVA